MPTLVIRFSTEQATLASIVWVGRVRAWRPQPASRLRQVLPRPNVASHHCFQDRRELQTLRVEVTKALNVAGRWTPLLILMALALALRVAHSLGQPLWGDEVFSLALATGHSVEGAPSTWRPELGDFVAFELPTAPGDLRGYLQHESPPASAARVVRAVLLSDTNPPGYYVALWLWTLVAGTQDISLRLFSVAWAVGCLPPLWGVGKAVGGQRVAFASCTLFSVLPLFIDYSIEARMYSMLWFWTISAAWLTLLLHRRGAQTEIIAIWTLVSAAGLLTHYFFAFAWLPMVIWLLIQPPRPGLGQLGAALIAILVLIAPWYSKVPQSLASWRITRDWLKSAYTSWQNGYHPLTYFTRNTLAAFFERSASESPTVWDNRLKAGYAVIGLALMTWAGRCAISGERVLAWLWLLGPVLGLFVFDAVQGTYAAGIPRYSLAAAPAAVVLAGVGLSHVPRRIGLTLLALLIAVSIPALNRLFNSDARASWFVPAAELLDRSAGPDKLVLVHSIPSGILGLARYTHATMPLALWTQQLRRLEHRDSAEAVVADVVRLIRGRRKVLVVAVHDVRELSPEIDFLRRHAKVEEEAQLGNAQVFVFSPSHGDVFTWPSAD